jgi:hypothetical protein
MKIIPRSILGLTVAAAAAFGVQAAHAQNLREVTMRIDEVKAVKECRGSFGALGADEIDLGAVVIDSKGAVRRRTMDLGQFGHDGTTKRPNRDFVAFRVSGNTFPKVNQVLLVLAERDSGGGFGKYLDRMVKEAEARVAAARPGRTTADAPGLRLVSTGEQAEAAAAEIGKELAKRLGEALLAVALDQREDDIFPASLQAVSVTGPAFRFVKGGLKETKVATFKKDQCHYTVKYTWHLVM